MAKLPATSKCPELEFNIDDYMSDDTYFDMSEFLEDFNINFLSAADLKAIIAAMEE